MNRSFKILHFCIEQCDSLSNHYHGTERDNIKFFCLSILDRLNFSAFGLKTLLLESRLNSKAEFSCGLTLRAFLLDYMILVNGVKEALDASDGKVKSVLNNFCCIWLADSIRHTIDNISILYKHKPSVLTTMYSNIVSLNKDLFDEYDHKGGKPKLKPKKPTPAKDLFLSIENTPFVNEKGIYEAYLYYSKYDHFGQMSYELSREKFVDRLDRLNKSISFMPKMLYYILLLLKGLDIKDEVISNAMRNTENFINELPNIEE